MDLMVKDFGTSPINYDKIKLEVTKKWETDNNDHVTSVQLVCSELLRVSLTAWC